MQKGVRYRSFRVEICRLVTACVRSVLVLVRLRAPVTFLIVLEFGRDEKVFVLDDIGPSVHSLDH